MRIVTIDLETFFDSRNGYTLKKQSIEEYVRDSRFIAHGAAIKWSQNHEAKWYDEPELRFILQQEDWSDVFLLAHHAAFDLFILKHHYGVSPAMRGCTLSMARLLLGNHLSVSLDSTRKHFNLPAKTTPYGLFDGKHWKEMTREVRQQVADGCVDETESIWTIFNLLGKTFPREEYDVVDSVIQMFTEPVLRADIPLLARVWETEAANKQRRLQELNIDAAELQSANKFTALLEAEGVEVETKQGKRGSIPAFAKTDQFMRDLLEHPNERIRTLAEARLGEKSTFLQTRAETLGWMARRGPLPVYLRYAGAGTLRVAGGDGGNWLNFKRNSDIRRSILAPEGYLIAPVDSSQIECRVLNYLAGQEDVIENFRVGRDPYIPLASAFYGEPIYRPEKADPRRVEMETKRGAGKQGELMCLGPDTKVLTDHGIKAILTVSTYDRLWDGIEWVEHQGLIFRGVRDVENYSGVEMTSDHLVLCGPQRWLPAASLQNENILFLALVEGSANLPLRALKSERKGVLQTWWFGVRAKLLNIRLTQQICMQVAQLDVLHAQQKQSGFGLKNIMAMLMFVRIKPTERGYSDASVPSTDVAINTQNIPTLLTMEGAASASIIVGAMIAERFSRTWSRCRGGMTQFFRLIESKTTRATPPAIYASQLESNKATTVVECETFKKKSSVFDLACAGPRNRFTILSSQGPLIVHNCGYGAAGPKFKATAKAGLYGPPIDMSLDDANRFVDLYRRTHQNVVAYWKTANRMLARVAGGSPLEWRPLTIRDRRIYLPNGCPLVYDTMEFHRPEPDEDCKDFERDGYWRYKTRQGWRTMWGAKLTQHICEAVSRVIVSQAMIRIKKIGFRTLNWPYDELLILIPRDGHEHQHLQDCMAEMKRTPDWLPGLPLDCEGHLGERYEK